MEGLPNSVWRDQIILIHAICSALSDDIGYLMTSNHGYMTEHAEASAEGHSGPQRLQHHPQPTLGLTLHRYDLLYIMGNL